jgi:ABC-type methionine transport system ATPase subunit
MTSLLSLDRVSLHHKRGDRRVAVLDDASLVVSAGEMVCVWARRGRGKTALLRVAAGIEAPDGGRVVFAGKDLARLSDRQRSRLLAQEIGWVTSARPNLDIPMIAHVALPLSFARGARGASGRARDALQRVGAADCAEQRWTSLADWERALVAIARGIVREPRLLLVDDLTAVLGLGETDEVMGLLARLARERELGVLCGVSSLAATSWADRLATLSGGELLMSCGEPTPRRDKVVGLPGAGPSA